MKEKKYGYEVEMYHLPADLGGGLMAAIPELPGCVGVGYTYEEALASVSAAADRFRQQATQPRISVNELFSYSDLSANELIAATE